MGRSDIQRSFIYGTRHSTRWRFLCPLPFQTNCVSISIWNTGLWTKYNSEISEILCLKFFVVFLSLFKPILGQYPKLGHVCLHPNPFPFIFQQQFCRLALHIPSYV